MIKRRAAMCTVGFGEAEPAECTAKKQKSFAEPTHQPRRLPVDLVGQSCRQSILSRSLPGRCAGADTHDQLILSAFLRDLFVGLPVSA
jgi:hypothetical protein